MYGVLDVAADFTGAFFGLLVITNLCLALGGGKLETIRQTVTAYAIASVVATLLYSVGNCGRGFPASENSVVYLLAFLPAAATHVVVARRSRLKS